MATRHSTPSALRALQGPVLGIFGGADQSIPLADVAAFERALKQAGVKSTVTVYPDQPHAFIETVDTIKAGGVQGQAWSQMLRFLEAALAARPAPSSSGSPQAAGDRIGWSYALRIGMSHLMGHASHQVGRQPTGRTHVNAVKRIGALLESESLAVVATSDQGAPYCSLVAIAAPETALVYFATTRSTHKWGNLSGDPRVSVLVDNRRNDPADFHEAAAATGVGTAEECLGEDAATHALRWSGVTRTSSSSRIAVDGARSGPYRPLVSCRRGSSRSCVDCPARP